MSFCRGEVMWTKHRYRTLRTQIRFGYCVLVGLCMLTMAIGWWGQRQLSTHFGGYEAAEQTLAAVLQIDREVQELKSRAESYLHTGSEPQYRAAIRLQKILQREINMAQLASESDELVRVLAEMKTHVHTFHRHLKVAAGERALRTQVTQVDLPVKGDEVQAAMDGLHLALNRLTPVPHEANQHLFAAVQSFAFAQKNLLQYFTNFRIDDFQQMIVAMSQAEVSIAAISESTRTPEVDAAQQTLLERLVEFGHLGRRAMQATRSYLYLSNVVMAGEVSEFVFYSNRLKAFVAAQKQRNRQQRQAAVERNRNLGVAASLLSILLAIGLATRLSFLIVLPISQITETFRRLSKGETIDDIPQASRDDEIGRMAKAAMVFSRKNDETSKLLDHSRQLSDQLAEKAKALEISNRELDNFAYVASHDLKAPLRGINALAQWVQDDCGTLLPEGSQQHLLQMQNRVGRMETLLNDLLEYSRVGRSQHASEHIDLAELVRSVMEIVDNPHDLQLIVGDSMPILDTDRSPLQQVILNLVTNAIKYHDKENDGWVKVTCVQGLSDLRIEVADNGMGIDPKFHNRIFQMYQRVATDKADGSGMGLAIVKKQIEGYGGTIEVRSQPGTGSTFAFTWPNRRPKAPEDLLKPLQAVS